MYRFLQIGIFREWLRLREIKFSFYKYISNAKEIQLYNSENIK